MKIIRLSQNLEYLNSIGVPENQAQKFLDYIISLEGKEKSNAIRILRKNPNMSLEDFKNIPKTKEQHQKKKIPDYIVEFANSLSPKYSQWLIREMMNAIQKRDFLIKLNRNVDANNVKKIIDALQTLDSFDRNYMRNIEDWASQNNIDLSQHTYSQANSLSQQWHEELAKKRKEEGLLYATNDVVYELDNGYKIVKLSPEDCETEGEYMGHCVGGYAEDIENGDSEIYSLRDKKNKPHVTIEIKPLYPFREDDDSLYIEQIQGKENDEPIPKYKEMIREWFLHLQNNENKTLEMETDEEIDYENFDEYMDNENEYGLKIDLTDKIGGNSIRSYEHDLNNLIELKLNKQNSWYRSNFDLEEKLNALIEYSLQNDQEEFYARALENEMDKEYENIMNYFYDYTSESENFPKRPDEEDYTTKVKKDPNQPEFNLGDDTKTIFDEEGFQKAEEEYEKAESEALEEYIDYYWEGNYKLLREIHKDLMKKIEEKKFNKEHENNEENEDDIQKQSFSINYVKTASNKNINPETLAEYIEALKLHAKNNKINDQELIDTINNLPYPDKIRKEFSETECNIIFEIVVYLWKKITGKDLEEDLKITNNKNKLEGCYWMIESGMLLSGLNHYSIIKQNINLFSKLLDINAFVIHEKLSGNPNELIKTIIANGGMRIYVDNQKAFFQLTDKTFSDWGGKRIKKLDFGEKFVKIIDVTSAYNGWKSGIFVRL